MGSSASVPTETILVVDDDSEVLSVAEDMLRTMAYTVISTVDPRGALRFARTHPGAIHLLLRALPRSVTGAGRVHDERLPGLRWLSSDRKHREPKRETSPPQPAPLNRQCGAEHAIQPEGHPNRIGILHP
jgi:CheY-like chemotaxis protein